VVSGEMIGFTPTGRVKPPKAHEGSALVCICPKQALVISNRAKILIVFKIFSIKVVYNIMAYYRPEIACRAIFVYKNILN
jgi:hypothetical protein